MSRSGTKKQDTTFNQSQQVGNTAQSNQSALAQTLTPMYTGEATNPQGFGSDLDAINTAGGQSTGGATAAVKGQAGLTRLRTGNRGTQQTLLDDSVRSAMRTNSQNALNTQVQNAQLKSNQQQAGIQGLQGLYGSNVNELLGSMGIGSNIANQQAQGGWFQNLTGLVGAVAGAAPKGTYTIGGS